MARERTWSRTAAVRRASDADAHASGARARGGEPRAPHAGGACDRRVRRAAKPLEGDASASQEALGLIARRRILGASCWKPAARGEVIRIECRGIGARLQE